MKYRSALCAACGGVSQVDPLKGTSFCSNCGTRLLVKDAIARFERKYPELAKKETEEPKQEETKKDAAAADETAAAAEHERKAKEEELAKLLAQADAHLAGREYSKADDIYNKIIKEMEPENHEAWWGLFRVDQRNFNFEETILQVFACYPFRKGNEKIYKDIAENANALNAIKYATETGVSGKYLEECLGYAEKVYNYYKEGLENLLGLAANRSQMLLNSWETIGICASANVTTVPETTVVKYLGEKKIYFRFLANTIGIIYFDEMIITPETSDGTVLNHYRNMSIDWETGMLRWSEYRKFIQIEDIARVSGIFDNFHAGNISILGLWNDRMIIRDKATVYYSRSCVIPDRYAVCLETCYTKPCVPIVEDPQSYNSGRKASEFFVVQAIRQSFDSNKRSKWSRVKGCYIATAVYGGYDEPEVLVLRQFRDEVLARSWAGRAFIRVYYALSPPLAGRLRKAGRLNAAVRAVLDSFVRKLKKKQV